ncbi:hypothetical protein [Flavobacterium phage FCOV-F14]|uniref:Uncharacterized protein n=8 Tax=Ficleduovirus FCL2 TaxID=2560473 RepID=A0A0A0YPR5_9CAUD|nr:hypothetical protein ABG42_gp53 [Flavobacterium phage FCL-2]QCW21163.1 hypothetical protein [Flavobacterium phage FCOV-F13]QCW21237.1 hypothetical protein [Flavobacterium phage FCOV-F16]QCW21539.1 hypothetical protein [Flavobacterium phage FCOV-F45]QCW21613.1 hypothetical protein [Flavobacterium phage FCOV-F46]QCW21687.1 hypothetical protein [Flavobacterium phage FCOV-F54]QNJ51709.1 hypothetical protein [Flavobacterium phage FCOV-F14]QNJ51783.1 hypothetical protein [Flavobacterium phage F
MFKLFRKKTEEEKINHRVDELFLKFICDNDFKFTELEQVQIVNKFVEKTRFYLEEKANENKSKSIEHEQKSNEIINAKSLLIK